MSDSRSCGECIYYNSIIDECTEASKCMRDVDEAKYTSYIEGKKQGRAEGYSQAENDYHKQTEKDRQSSYDCGYQQGKAEAIEEELYEYAFWLFTNYSGGGAVGGSVAHDNAVKSIEEFQQWQKGEEND